MTAVRRLALLAIGIAPIPFLCARVDASPCGAVFPAQRFFLPGGGVPPGLREPSDPPPGQPPPTTPPDAPPTTSGTPPDTGGPSTPGGGPSAPPSTGALPTPPPGNGPTTGDDRGRGRSGGRDEAAWEVWWAVHRFEFLRLADHSAVTTGEGSGRISSADRAQYRKRMLKIAENTQDFRLRGAALAGAIRLAQNDEISSMAQIAKDALRTHNLVVAMFVGNALSHASAVGLVPFVEPVAKDVDIEEHVRGLVALALPGLWADGADAQLVQMLREDRGREPAFEEAIVTALGSTHDPEGTAELERVVKNLEQRPALRATAVQSLARRGLDSLPLILKCLEDRRIEVRRAAATGLGILPWAASSDAVAAAAELKKSGDAGTDGLGKLAADHAAALDEKTKKAWQRLQQVLLNEREKSVRAMAALSLGRIAKATGATMPIRLLLADAARTNDLREYDMLALGISGDPRALPLCMDALRSSHSAPSTRAAASIALGLLGLDEAAPALRTILEENVNPQVRGYAAIALGMLRDTKSQKSIRHGFDTVHDEDSRGQFAIAMGLLGNGRDAQAIADRFATGGSPGLLWNFIEALRLSGHVGPAAKLLAVAEDPMADAGPDALRALAGIVVPNDAGKTEKVAAFDHIHGDDYLLAYMIDP